MFTRPAPAVPLTVAGQITGFLVRDAARFRFVAADCRFAMLDGSKFVRVPDAQRAADRLAAALAREWRPAAAGAYGSA
jgi:hypothetical protein